MSNSREKRFIDEAYEELELQLLVVDLKTNDERIKELAKIIEDYKKQLII